MEEAALFTGILKTERGLVFNTQLKGALSAFFIKQSSSRITLMCIAQIIIYTEQPLCAFKIPMKILLSFTLVPNLKGTVA
jgi:thiosulfate reductase cytochrome b subunit